MVQQSVSLGCVVPASDLVPQEVAELRNRLSTLSEITVFSVNDSGKYPFKLTDDSDIVILNHGGKIGKAESVRRGIEYLLDHSECTHIAQVDGTLKQNPADVRDIVRRLSGEPATQLGICDRYAFQDISQQNHRSAVRWFFSSLVHAATGKTYPDTACGNRVYTRAFATNFLRESISYGYGLEVEQLIVAAAHSAEVTTVGVHSETQADSTAAEKIEDNLFVILAKCRHQISSTAYAQVCKTITSIKERLHSFNFDNTVLAHPGITRFDYLEAGEDGEPCYRLSRQDPSAGEE